MKQPVQIRFLHMDASEALEAVAREKATMLDRFRPDLMSCQVTIERADRHKRQGRQFAVRIDVTMNGAELHVGRVHDEDAYVALRDAFDDMKRRIQDSARRVQGQVKDHARTLAGEVVRLDAEGRFGFIRSADGEDYWFGPDNVADTPFEHLAVGTAVRFIPDLAGEGRQAKRVSAGKHGFR